MTLVAGMDSSTQSCKVLVCDADTGQVVREQRRDQVANLAQAPDYRAGAVVSTKA